MAAGAVGDHDLAVFRKTQPDALREIHVTPAIPRQLVAVRRGLDPRLVKRIREVLLEMDKSEAGRAVLAGFENTTRFDELPGGTANALAPIDRLTREGAAGRK